LAQQEVFHAPLLERGAQFMELARTVSRQLFQRLDGAGSDTQADGAHDLNQQDRRVPSASIAWHVNQSMGCLPADAECRIAES
jgi:hypothetical protein